MKGISTTVNGSAISVNLYPATVTPTLPARLVTVGQFPANNPSFSRAVQVSDQYVFVKRGSYGVAIDLSAIVTLALTQEPNLTWTPPVVLTQAANKSCVHSSASAVFSFLVGSEYNVTYAWYELGPISKSAATITLGASLIAADGTSITSNNTNVSDGDTLTVGGKTYTFKTALTPTEGEVLIGANADASLLNLIRAINHTGTPDTDYKCAAANVAVSADAAVTSHSFNVYPKALTTAGIYAVNTPSSGTASTLTITPTDTNLNGVQYYCIATDDASSPGSVASNIVILTVT